MSSSHGHISKIAHQKEKCQNVSMAVLAENRKAHFEFEILEPLEAGIELFGFEVKAIKTNKMSSQKIHRKITNPRVKENSCCTKKK